MRNRQGELTPIAVSISPLGEDLSAPNTLLTVCHKLPEKLSGAIVDPPGTKRAETGQDQELYFQGRKAEAIGGLASGLTHDFNNILTSLFAHLDLMISAPEFPKEFLTHATRSRASATRAAELVTRLLAFSRQARPVLAPLQLPTLFDECLLTLRRSLDGSIQVVCPAPAQDLWSVQADATQLTLAITNLCFSSRDAMPKGGTLSLEVINATLTDNEAKPPRRAGEFVRLTVADTGKGISPDVFARLAGSHFTGKEFGKGPALGLSIAHSIITEHGGWLEIETELGQGSRFHAYLPRSKDAPASQPLPH